MGRRERILAEIAGIDGFSVREHYFEAVDGRRVVPVGRYDVLRETTLVLLVAARWMPRCPDCGGACRVVHERLERRRWRDLSWAEHPVEIEYAPRRVKCPRCKATPVEMLPWAEPKQRQSRRLQQHLALQAASMPIMHVAIQHGLSWSTVRRAEEHAIARWERTRPPKPLRMLGVDEKWLGRRHKLDHKFVTIVSNLETGEPIWIGRGRDGSALRMWLSLLSSEQKRAITLVAMDMHAPFRKAVLEVGGLEHVDIAHDPFHVMKRVGDMIDDLRRSIFFRAAPYMREIACGTRWLLLRAWERNTPKQRKTITVLLAHNHTLARAYQIKEELREFLRAPSRKKMEVGLDRILRRTQRRYPAALRRLHNSLRKNRERILALGKHQPPTGRIEALNNNWETLIRRSRGCRDHAYLLRKLRFMVANPLRDPLDVRRFLALGITPPLRHAA
jgi:transposase